jgi:hypothetical protein
MTKIQSTSNGCLSIIACWVLVIGMLQNQLIGRFQDAHIAPHSEVVSIHQFYLCSCQWQVLNQLDNFQMPCDHFVQITGPATDPSLSHKHEQGLP